MQSGSTPTVSDYFADLNAPNVDDMKLQLDQLVQQGVITPEDAQTISQNPSAYNGIQTDPNLKQNQMDALLGLQNISDSGGMTTTDKANLQGIQNTEAATAKGNRDSILQNAEARGMGGSGLSLLDQLTNAQDSATRQSTRDLDVAGQSKDRALQALIQAGTQSGNMQAQEFGQKAQVAGANDAISRFNAQNQQAVINQNVANQNAAQTANLQAKQNVADANTSMRNQQQQYNKQLQQQNFENELKKRQGEAGIATQNANSIGQNSAATANANNQGIGAGLGVFSSVLKGQGKEDGGIVEGMPTEHDSVPTMLKPGEMVIRKEDVPDMLVKAHTDEDGNFDAAAFLDSITGHKYGYSKKGVA